MPRSAEQKIRLLILYDILRKESDADTPLSTNELIEKLNEYYVDTVGKNGQAIKEYIVSQLKYDKEADQISIFDPRDPFTGKQVTNA